MTYMSSAKWGEPDPAFRHSLPPTVHVRAHLHRRSPWRQPLGIPGASAKPEETWPGRDVLGIRNQVSRRRRFLSCRNHLIVINVKDFAILLLLAWGWIMIGLARGFLHFESRSVSQRVHQPSRLPSVGTWQPRGRHNWNRTRPESHPAGERCLRLWSLESIIMMQQ